MIEDPNKGLTFHYNRQRRLEHASENVKKSYDEGYTPNRGFLKGLTSNAGMRSIFVSIIILTMAVISLAFLGNGNDTDTIEGIKTQIKAFLYEDSVYVTISCERQKKTVSGNIPILTKITTIDLTDTIVSEKVISGVLEDSTLNMRAILPDNKVKTVTASVKVDKTESILTVTVDRK